MDKIKSFCKKHKQLFVYMMFGFITTVISIGACFLTLKLGVAFIHDENGNPNELLDILASTVQWVVGVAVAFITSKLWVFKDAEHGAISTLKQICKFAGGRLLTYFVEVAINLSLIALLEVACYKSFVLPLGVFSFEVSSRVWAKLGSSLVIVITNYFISKLIVFKSKKESKLL